MISYISDTRLADMLPYGPMVDDITVLLHDPPGLRRSGVPKYFGLGRLWRLTQPNVDATSTSALHHVSNALAHILRDLPLHVVFEARMTMRPSHEWPAWEALRQGLDDTPSVQWFRDHTQNGMPHHLDRRPARLMHIECHMGLRMPLDLKIPARYGKHLALMLSARYDASLAVLEDLLRTYGEKQVGQFRDLTTVIEEEYRTRGFEPTALDAEGLTEVMARALNPVGAKPLYDPTQPLRMSVGTTPLTLDVETCAAGGLEARVYSLKKPVAQTYPGMLSAVRRPSGLTLAPNLWELAQTHPVTVVTQITLPNQEVLAANMSRRQMFGNMIRQGWAGENRSETAARISDFEAFANRLAGGNEQGARVATHIVAWQGEGAPAASDHLFRAACKRIGLELHRETLICHTLFTRALPLGNDPRFPAESSLDRMRTIPLTNAAHYLPVFGCFSGFGQRTASVPVLSKRGEPVAFDILRDNRRPHFTVIGSNRSGKSAFVNWMANNLIPRGDSFIFIDRHGSYKALCDILGGRHYTLTLEQPVCFGPFDGPLDREHRAFLRNIIVECCTNVGAHDVTTLRHPQVVVVGEMLRQWADSRDALLRPTLGEFAEYLVKRPIAGKEADCEYVADLLKPFYGDGDYAGFVDGPNDVDVQRGLWSFDLFPLSHSRQLLNVITAMILDRVDRFIRASENLHHMKYIIMDEVSFELKSQQINDIIQAILRAYARYFCAIGLVTQQMRDFRGEVGEIVRNNCGSLWAFALSPDEAQAFVDTFQLEPHVVNILKNLRSHDDCSEAYVQIADEGGGEFVVSGDPEFFKRIGQSQHHRAARAAMEASA